MARPYWQNCVAHFDERVAEFVGEYFGEIERRCLLVAAAGFDPRSRHVAALLSSVLGNRLSGLFIREERGTPSPALVQAAQANALSLSSIVANSTIESVDIFGDDTAPVAGARIAAIIGNLEVPTEVTDIVLDMTALSIGVGFPAAKLLLERCETTGIAFHIMIASNPELDDVIASEPGDRPMAVRGFAGSDLGSGDLEVARIWVPHLSKGRSAALNDIGRSIGETYKICPVVPFPARDAHRSDALIAEYGAQLFDEWEVDPRDLVYVSERNPLDCYRTLSTLKERYERTVEGIFEPAVILSPIGSRVMAAGAFMAALEHDLPVHYIETVRYDFDPAASEEPAEADSIVHLLLSGPAYLEFEASDSLIAGQQLAGSTTE